MTSRRQFLARIAAGPVALALGGGKSAAGAQQRGAMHDSSIVRDTTNLFAMDQRAARSVRLPPKPNATPLLTNVQRDELEHRIRCQCGCTLDVFTCRTTDFSCQVSPAMHADVMALVQGGYSAQEIIDAFVSSYGERVLMAPRKSGFNLFAWFTPGVAVVVGGVLIAAWLRRWRNEPPPPVAPSVAAPIDATDDELARLDAAVRGDDRA
ncbi:MAG: cytochrome c-type biogenesis protein CcmH [Deltaproteobacteria bacterium]